MRLIGTGRGRARVLELRAARRLAACPERIERDGLAAWVETAERIEHRGRAVAGDERPHSVPPGAHGGNIDVNLLVEGTSLLLPVQVEGALAYVGDPHFAQGGGEVALTALEASLRATLRFDVVPRERALAEYGELTGPLVETPELIVPTGLHEDLGEAMRCCVRSALALLRARWGVEEHLAYAYLSAATDFDVSQVVDVVCGVHARIRTADFAGVPR